MNEAFSELTEAANNAIKGVQAMAGAIENLERRLKVNRMDVTDTKINWNNSSYSKIPDLPNFSLSEYLSDIPITVEDCSDNSYETSNDEICIEDDTPEETSYKQITFEDVYSQSSGKIDYNKSLDNLWKRLNDLLSSSDIPENIRRTSQNTKSWVNSVSSWTQGDVRKFFKIMDSIYQSLEHNSDTSEWWGI